MKFINRFDKIRDSEQIMSTKINTNGRSEYFADKPV